MRGAWGLRPDLLPLRQSSNHGAALVQEFDSRIARGVHRQREPRLAVRVRQGDERRTVAVLANENAARSGGCAGANLRDRGVALRTRRELVRVVELLDELAQVAIRPVPDLKSCVPTAVR